VNKPILLDVCCGAGGITRGFQDAGFYVVGVDNQPQPRYCGDEFYRDDCIHFLGTQDLSRYDAFHASAPCQGFSLASTFHAGTQEKYSNLIPEIRERFQQIGKPYTIENVAGSPLIKALMLCGTMFGLNVVRHRYFESNLLIFQPAHYPHAKRTGKPGAVPAPGEYWCVGGHFGQKHNAQAAMGIDWMDTQREIANALPPEYGRYIGSQLLDAIGRDCAGVA
jgi:DNA (cytosine-5)-methyltransferase 1